MDAVAAEDVDEDVAGGEIRSSLPVISGHFMCMTAATAGGLQVMLRQWQRRRSPKIVHMTAHACVHPGVLYLRSDSWCVKDRGTPRAFPAFSQHDIRVGGGL